MNQNPPKRPALILVDTATEAVVAFARFLISHNFEINSSGECLASLKSQGVDVVIVNDTLKFELVLVTFTKFIKEFGTSRTTRTAVMTSFYPERFTFAMGAIHGDKTIVLTSEKRITDTEAWITSGEPDKTKKIYALNIQASEELSDVAHKYARSHAHFCPQ